MYKRPIDNLLLRTARRALYAIDVDRVSPAGEYLGNLGVSDFLPAYARRKQLR